MNLFHPDSPLMKGLSHIADWMLMSLLWVIGCMPLLTIGASTSAICYCAFKKTKAEGTVFKNFVRSFKQNLIPSLPVTLICAVLGVFLYFLFGQIQASSSQIIQILLVIPAFLIFSTICFVFPLLARFDLRLPALFRNAFLLTVTNIPTAMLVSILTAIPLLLPILWPEGFFRGFMLLLFLIPGVLAQITVSKLAPLFRRYFEDQKDGQ